MALTYRQPVDSSSSKSTIRLVLSAIAFLVFATTVIIYLFNHSLTDIAKNQLVAIRENDLQKAYAMTTTAFKEQTSFDAFKQYIDTYPAMRHNVDVSFNDMELENDFGYVKGIVTGKDGTNMIIEYQFVKEDSRWMIQGIRLSTLEE